MSPTPTQQHHDPFDVSSLEALQQQHLMQHHNHHSTMSPVASNDAHCENSSGSGNSNQMIQHHQTMMHHHRLHQQQHQQQQQQHENIMDQASANGGLLSPPPTPNQSNNINLATHNSNIPSLHHSTVNNNNMLPKPNTDTDPYHFIDDDHLKPTMPSPSNSTLTSDSTIGKAPIVGTEKKKRGRKKKNADGTPMEGVPKRLVNQ